MREITILPDYGAVMQNNSTDVGDTEPAANLGVGRQSHLQDCLAKNVSRKVHHF
jgi:hypothetical protein